MPYVSVLHESFIVYGNVKYILYRKISLLNDLLFTLNTLLLAKWRGTLYLDFIERDGCLKYLASLFYSKSVIK